MKEDILKSALKEITVYGDITSHKAEIDSEDLSWILQILSTNLYSDPIGSLIREYSSNAWDANVEAGKADKPIEVGLVTASDKGTYWYVTDLGEGLSPEKIDNVYRKFGKSTKRNSNESIGMMGLGKFSGLSYSNEVYVTTRVDCVEYEYLMHKSEGVPQIDLLCTKNTDLPSGTTIKIYIKNWSDRKKFIEGCQNQLAYFENVYFNVPEVDNNFTLIKAKTFTYSSLESRALRIKIGPVSYPINAGDLNSHTISYDSFAGLALNFNIGELAITPNRESLLFNKQTIENIENRLLEFKKELLELYDSQVQEYTDLNKFIEALQYNIVTIGNKTYHINNNMYPSVTLKQPKLKGLGVDIYLPSKTLLFYGYQIKYTIDNSKIKPVKSERHYWPYDDNKDFLLGKSEVNNKVAKYLYETYPKSGTDVIKKVKTKLLPCKSSNSWYKDTQNYFTILKLHKYPKTKWRSIIKSFQDWQKEYIKNNTIEIDSNLPSKEWLKTQKVAKSANNLTSLRKSTGKILVKYAGKSSRYGVDAVFINNDKELKTLGKEKKFIIYGADDAKDYLAGLYKMFNATTCITAKINHKYLELAPNYINITKFMEGNHKVFRKYVSLILLHKKLDSYSKITECRSLLVTTDTKSYNELEEAITESRNYKNIYNDELTKSMLEVAEKTNLWDPTIIEMVDNVENICKKYSFLPNIDKSDSKSYSSIKNYTKSNIDFFIEICKLKKIKLNLEHYVGKPKESDTQETNQLS